MSNHTPWKYLIPTEHGHEAFEVQMHSQARILSVRTVRGEPVIYAMVNPGAVLVPRRLVVLRTGVPGPDDIDQLAYIGSYEKLEGQLVWHIFISPDPHVNATQVPQHGDRYLGLPLD